MWDAGGNRLLDGLSSLFCVNVGHGRAEMAQVAFDQMRQLGFYANWGETHPNAVCLAERIADLAPGDLNRVFFTSGGSEAVESAWKLARSYHRRRDEPTRTKVITREGAYHGTSMGALSATAISAIRRDFEPLVPGGCHVPNTGFHQPDAQDDAMGAADAIESRILEEGPESIGAIILEPVQSGGGCLTPPDGYFQRVREICDRHGVLLISDEVTCGWGRLGYRFGCQRYDLQPDMITTAKGLTSGYAPLGAVIVSDRIAEAFADDGARFAHGFTFGGHPVSTAIALENLEILDREDLYGHVFFKERRFRQMLGELEELPAVADVRGAGYFHSLELAENVPCLEANKAALALACRENGLLCRVTSRDGLVIQLAPPLIADDDQFSEMGQVLHAVLSRPLASNGPG